MSKPQHIAIIMDGNGRWAQQRKLPRIAGHNRGVEALRTVVEHCVANEIPILTLFAFSSENWRRPATEVKFLMSLLSKLLLEEVHQLQEIRRFSIENSTGDKSLCAAVPEDAAIWVKVTSTAENCLGAECPNFRDCFVMKARKTALEADIVVVNHHLFFADAALRSDGIAELLPACNTIIFDEAHQIPDIATQFFGQTISTRQCLELSRDVVATTLAVARDAQAARDTAQSAVF